LTLRAQHCGPGASGAFLTNPAVPSGEQAEPAMTHKGKWSGCVFENLECDCQFASIVTEWLILSHQQKAS
jgi:hypothetical protein